MSSRRGSSATKHRYDIELGRSVTPTKKRTLFSLPPSVFASSRSCYFFSYASAFCLFIYFWGISFSSWEAGFGYSALLLKLMLDQATSSTSCPYDKEKGKMRYSLRKRLNVGFLQRGLSRFLLFFYYLSSPLLLTHTSTLIYSGSYLQYWEATHWSRTWGSASAIHLSDRKNKVIF